MIKINETVVRKRGWLCPGMPQACEKRLLRASIEAAGAFYPHSLLRENGEMLELNLRDRRSCARCFSAPAIFGNSLTDLPGFDRRREQSPFLRI